MRATRSVMIDRPVGRVWELVGDLRQWPSWTDMERVALLSQEMAEGSEIAYQWRNRDIRATVNRFRQGEVMGITAPQPSYHFEEWIAIRPSSGGTRVTFAMQVEPTTWWTRILSTLLAPFSGLLMGPAMRRELIALKEAAERS